MVVFYKSAENCTFMRGKLHFPAFTGGHHVLQMYGVYAACDKGEEANLHVIFLKVPTSSTNMV